MYLQASSYKYYTRRPTTEELPCFAVCDLKKSYFHLPPHRVITVSPVQSCGVDIFATLWEEGGRLRQTLLLTRTRQHLGGERLWLKCGSCNQRRTKLYIYQDMFECRSCFGLSYNSRQLTPFDYHDKKAQEIEQALGYDPSNMLKMLPWEYPLRPKYMHQKTYQKLLLRLDHHRAVGFNKTKMCCKKISNAL